MKFYFHDSIVQLKCEFGDWYWNKVNHTYVRILILLLISVLKNVFKTNVHFNSLTFSVRNFVLCFRAKRWYLSWEEYPVIFLIYSFYTFHETQSHYVWFLNHKIMIQSSRWSHTRIIPDLTGRGTSLSIQLRNCGYTDINLCPESLYWFQFALEFPLRD